MGLTKCPDCGAKVSTEAVECPHCGNAQDCPDCGGKVKPTAKKCRHCGRPDPFDYWAMEEADELSAEMEEELLEQQEENRGNDMAILFIAIVFFGAVYALYWLFS